ncbi:MAG: DUF1269 domain-containing protein [Chloroflexales bacterium]|nr:DUF1269 domain-containing protein [Chloroflexales bacterium]
MATMSVLKFTTPDGAERMESLLQSLQKQQLITVQDAAIVTWPADKKKPKTRQLHNMAGLGALDGAFWGMLFGLLFFVPLFGMAVGAGIGALTGAMTDIGIDDKFISEVRQKVTPGTSALFVMTSGAVQDRVIAAIKDSGLQPDLIASNLTQEQEIALKTAFTA